MKKAKSVERVKIVKRANPTKPEINQQQNDNANAQIVQVIFPPDTELRKVRKKRRKGKSPASKKKDELLETLKQRLNEYDQLQAQAQKSGVKIPSELGVSLINKSDLKTNEDIQNYINDVTRKISLLQELIEKAQAPAQVGFPLRLGSGVAPQLPSLPAFPQQPRFIPQQPIPTQPSRTPTQPSRTPTQPQPDQTKETLDRISREIRDRLKERGESFDEPESQSGIMPPTEGDPEQSQPATPAIPQAQPDPEDLVTLKGIKVGNKLLNIVAPKGWEPEYKSFSQYVNNVERIVLINEKIKDVYHIPLADENNLYKERDNLKTSYDKWFSSLKDNLKLFVLQQPPMNIVHIDLIQDLELTPEELAKKLFKEQGKRFIEITAGNQAPSIETKIQQGGENPFNKQEDNKAYQNYEKKYASVTSRLVQIRTEIDQLKTTPPSSREVMQSSSLINTELNELDEEMTKQYDSVPDFVKLGVSTKQDTIMDRINQLRVANGNLGQIAPRPREIKVLTKRDAIKVLKTYVNASRPNMTAQRKDAIKLLFGDDFMAEVSRTKPAAAKRAVIAEEFITFMKTEEPNWKPKNIADRNPQQGSGRTGQGADDTGGSKYFGSEPTSETRDNDVRTIQRYLEASYQGSVFQAIPVDMSVREAVKRLFGTDFLRRLDDAATNSDKYSVIYNKAFTYREEGSQFILDNLGKSNTQIQF